VAGEPFDLETLRRRWAMAASSAKAASPTASRAAVVEPLGPTSTIAANGPTEAASPLADAGSWNAAVGTANVEPLGLFAQAHANLRELRRSVEASVGRDVSTIEPFLRRVEQAIAQIEGAASAPSSAAADAPPGAAAGVLSGFGQGSAAAAPKALRAELEDALFDLEDLLEVFLIVSK
jgi:hypothetical protein